MNGTVSCDTYSDCSDDIENVFCSITGKGHTYPGMCVVVVAGCALVRANPSDAVWAMVGRPACTPNSREENCGDIDGTRALWDFFVASVAP